MASCTPAAAAAQSEWPGRQSAASCQLFGWRQSLCSAKLAAKGGAAAALLLHKSGVGAEWERGVGAAAERCWCSVQTESVLCGNAPIR